MQVPKFSVNINCKWIHKQVKVEFLCFKISKSPAIFHFYCVQFVDIHFSQEWDSDCGKWNRLPWRIWLSHRRSFFWNAFTESRISVIICFRTSTMGLLVNDAVVIHQVFSCVSHLFSYEINQTTDLIAHRRCTILCQPKFIIILCPLIHCSTCEKIQILFRELPLNLKVPQWWKTEHLHLKWI